MDRSMMQTALVKGRGFNCVQIVDWTKTRAEVTDEPHTTIAGTMDRDADCGISRYL